MANGGLSSLNFMGGAMKGYNFAEGIKDKRRQRKQQDKQMEMREEQFDMRRDEHEASMRGQKQQEKLRGFKIDQIKDQQAQRMNQLVAATLEAGDATGLSQEDQDLLAAHPNLNAQRILSPEFGQALDTAEKVFEGEIDRNSPEAMQAFETLVPEIQLGATEGRQVHPRRIVPGRQEGTFMVDMEVEGQEGSAPLTDRRSADPDDPVTEIKLDDLMGRIEVAKRYREVLSDPQGREAFKRMYGASEGQAGEVFEHPDLGWVQQQPDGTLKQYDPADGGKGGSGGSDSPAAVKTVRFLQQEMANEGVELSTEKAWEMYKTASSDPTRYVSDYVDTRMEAQEFAPEGEKKTPEQLEDEAIRSYQRIRQQLSGSGGRRRSGQQGGGRQGNNRETDPQTQGDPDMEDFWGSFIGQDDNSRQQRQPSRQRSEGGQQGQAPDQSRAEQPPDQGGSGEKRYSLGLADAFLPEQARDAVADAPGRAVRGVSDAYQSFTSKANAQAAFNKHAHRDIDDVPLDVLEAYAPYAKGEEAQRIAQVIQRKRQETGVSSR